MDLIDDFAIYTEEISDEVGKAARKYETYARVNDANMGAQNALAKLSDGERIMIALAILAMVIN